jgi:hypothetical protein
MLFADHRRIAGIPRVVIEIVADEIEEGTNVGIADTLVVGLVAFGESNQESQDIVGCYLIDFKLAEFQTELINDRLEGSNRVFFGMGPRW